PPSFVRQLTLRPAPCYGIIVGSGAWLASRSVSGLQRMVEPTSSSAQNVLEQLLADAIGQHQSGQFAAAERCYRRILNARPDHVEARHLLGVLRFQQGRHQEALDLIARALRAQPNYPEALYNYGNILS